jgi:dTDP-4-dehydrorhamnose reductase
VRVLITGAGGQVGHELVEAFAGHEVVAAEHTALDVTDRAAVFECVASAAPDVVIYAAARTAVDDCERDPARAMLVNTDGTRHMVEAADRAGARVVYFSTDYVLDGDQLEPYVESDAPNPRSVYGASKLGGERACVPTTPLCGSPGCAAVTAPTR